MKQTLKFLGRGSAFNTAEENTSAYFIKDNILFLIDCGETVFHRLTANDKLKKLIAENQINDIQVYITHLHSDHVGSLSSLIYYCYFVLGIKIKVHYPDIRDSHNGYTSNLAALLKLQGNIADEHYEHIKYAHRYIFSHPVKHNDNLESYGYTVVLDDAGYRKAYYSGDCKRLSASTLININNGFYDEIYLECATVNSGVHMTFEYLNEVIDSTVKDKVYLMHIDNTEKAKELADKYGFKIVELDK